jgi:G6PDH family F420-dependent oxidoreductase
VPKYGLTLLCEVHGPNALVDQAHKGEETGFDFLVISDHFHPWLPEHEHSPFAWSVLGAIAAQTSRVELATMVTCPFMRYHPAVIAQAAATIGVMSNGRFTLGLGAGERLNEHVVGGGWPSVVERHERLVESAEVIRELWSGDVTTYRGKHVTVEQARLYDVPEQRPGMYLAVSGEESVASALEVGEGICAVAPERPLVEQFVAGGGDAQQTWGQLALSWDADRQTALEFARARFRFGLPGWRVMAELPDPQAFDAATKLVEPDDMADQVPSGSDPDAVIESITKFVDAGYEHVAVVQVGDDLDGFLRAWQEDIRPKLP